jgi:hypothetical protein
VSPRGRRGRTALSFLLALAVLLPLGSVPPAAQAGPCDPPITNPIVCENSQAGTPSSAWDSGFGDGTIQGFTTDISVNKGGTVTFKVKTPANAFHLDVYRMGYYGGNGARLVATIPNSATIKQTQPACLTGPNDQNGNKTGLPRRTARRER